MNRIKRIAMMMPTLPIQTTALTRPKQPMRPITQSRQTPVRCHLCPLRHPLSHRLILVKRSERKNGKDDRHHLGTPERTEQKETQNLSETSPKSLLEKGKKKRKERVSQGSGQTIKLSKKRFEPLG